MTFRVVLYARTCALKPRLVVVDGVLGGLHKIPLYDGSKLQWKLLYGTSM